ncbi:UTRA domain-containing protein [Chromohalobacter israelensis]|uniref:UTRA domain-containing protein n=1 Tax=Chromohalobacter israelensis TaxID=141390 RepID=UPI00265C3ADD|nr:UTRA domain-containing protein [Chromohalobacter salexigens]MDO0945348.1 UTRA domain-containing protein [Chromohalobacter salexigens]
MPVPTLIIAANDAVSLGNPMPDTPFYLQLCDRLVALIESGELGPASRLPAERLLAERFATTRVTLRQALSQLESEGRIHRRNRRGWFVSPPRVDYAPDRDQSFTQYVTAQGRRPFTQVLSVCHRPAPPTVAQALAIPPEHTVLQVQRRRYIDDRAVLLERIWLRDDLLPGLSEVDFTASLWQRLHDDYGIDQLRKSLRLYPTALTGTEAETLGVHSGCAGLCVTRTTYDRDGRALEYDEDHWLHDAICIRADVDMT